MNLLTVKLVDYSSSDSENETTKKPETTPTPITFRGKRVFRRIIQSAGASSSRKATPKKKIQWAEDDESNFMKMDFEETTPKKKFWPPKEESNLLMKMDTCEEATPRKKRGAKEESGRDVDTCEEMTPKKKRWGKEESHRLKLAMKAAINPTTDEHWELICKSLGGNHTIDECKEQALKLNWKPPPPLPDGGTSSKKEEVQTDESAQLVSNSPWKKLVDKRKSRRSVECANKFFDENISDLTLTDLNLDDSLFNAAFSTPPEQAKCARRPFLIRVVADDDAEKDSSDDAFNN